MNCAFSKESLALHVEGDLSAAAAAIASSHLETCEDCREFFEQLRKRQLLLKSLRRESGTPSEFAKMRAEVMSVVNNSRNVSGWALRLERALVPGFRRRGFAVATLAAVAIVLALVLPQMRVPASATGESAAVFEDKDTLLQPTGYREWIFAGTSSGKRHSTEAHPSNNVYIKPSAYQEYKNTGKFPEGTVLVLEAAGLDALLVSVKDSRFNGGWGFFDFTGDGGKSMPRAQALPESSGCLSCHEQHAAADHVFTQFYPALSFNRRAIRNAFILSTSSASARRRTHGVRDT
jgi:hypothetical protein